MPRVPMLSGPQLEAQIPNTPAPSLLSGSPALGNAIRQVGGAVEQAAGKIEEGAIKAQREAEAVIGADADLELDARNEAVKSETFKLKGLSASEGRSKAVEQLGKNRQEVAARIKSPEERNRFLVRSATAVIASRRQVESHVGREFDAAREGAVKATEDSAITKAESGVLDPAEFSLVETNAIRTIRSTQRSEEEGSQRIADFQSRVSAAFTAGLLAQGRADDAAKYVEASRGALGGRYVEAKGMVDRANAGAQKDRLIAEGAKLVDGSAESLRMENPDGYVTEEQLRGAVKLEETDPGIRGEVEQALERRIRLEANRLRTDIGTNRDNVNRGDLTGEKGAKFGESINFLEKHDPDFLLARDARRRAEARAWKALQSGDARTRAAEAKAQREVDLQFRYRLEHALVDDPAAKPDEVLTAFIAERAKEGDDVTVSDTERERGGATAAKASKKATTSEGAEERSAAKRFEDTFTKATPVKKGQPRDQVQLNERVGKALSLFRQRTEAKGKPLDEAELAGIEAELMRDVKVEVPGRFYGTNQVTKKAVDLIEAQAAEEKLVGGKAFVKRNGKWVAK
ncbi:MAG: hypothetical protein Q8K32_09315 [Archangium sp.]|nr:hypothetical protein [Archangium sp.]